MHQDVAKRSNDTESTLDLKENRIESQVLNAKPVDRERRVWERCACLTCGKAAWRVRKEERGGRGECDARAEPRDPAARCGWEGDGPAAPAGSWPRGPGQAAGGRACPGNCPSGAVRRGRVLRAGSAALGGFRWLPTWPGAR